MGVIVNTLTVFIGGLLGVLLNTGISEKMADAIMKGIALVILVIGIDGALIGENTIIMVLSIVIGAVIGNRLDIDEAFNKFVQYIEKKIVKNRSTGTFSQAFITSTLLFCVGSMAIIGSLESGLTGNHSTLYTKSVIDGISALIFASSLGPGVIFSGFSVLILQGSIALMAGFLQPLLPTPIVNEIIATGSVLLIGLGLNMLNLTDLKILNYTPAIILPIVIMQFI